MDTALTDVAPRRDSRLVGYALIAAVGLVVGLLTGEPEPMAMAVAAIAVLVYGLRDLRPVHIDATVEIDSDRVIQGDTVTVNIELHQPAGHDLDLRLTGTADQLGELDVVSDTHAGVTHATVSIAADRWGRHELGRVAVRGTKRGSLLTWEAEIADLGALTVLPRAERLQRLLAPRASNATAGTHPARLFTGNGSEFVDIRPYQAGDRLRDLNWRATARAHAPHVNRRRPERGGDVVVLLDALPDRHREHTEVGGELLQRAGQATWALVRNHLAAQDRVGLMTYAAGRVAWLAPEGSTRTRYRILETLLDGAGGTTTRGAGDQWMRHDIPPSALVIGVSPLANDQMLRSLAALRGRGRATCMLAIDPSSVISRTGQFDGDVMRLATIVFNERVSYLRRLGTPIVAWRPGQDLDRAVRRLESLTRRATSVGSKAPR